jgi:hypothetical protein
VSTTAIIVVTAGVTIVSLVWALAWMVVRTTGSGKERP